MSTTAIVLAGGRATRFGGDKLALELGGRTILDRAVDAVLPIADEVVVVGRLIEHPNDTVRFLADPEPGGGPLVGLSAALDAASGSQAIAVGGDMPFLVSAVLEALLGRLALDLSIGGVILGPPERADSGSRRQVLPVALDVDRARAAARALVDRGDRSLQALLDGLGWVELAADAWLPLDPQGRTLFDVDTPADLDEIRARLAY